MTSSTLRALAVLNDMQAAGVIETYAIGGAVAAIYYTEPTNTSDLDIFVTFPAGGGRSLLDPLRPILEHLAARGFREFAGESIVIESWPVQFLPVANALDEEGLVEAEAADFGLGEESVPTRVLRPEHLAALALRTGRAKDQLRVAQLLQFAEVNGFDVAKFTDVLGRHDLLDKWQAYVRSFNPVLPPSAEPAAQDRRR